MRIRSLFAAFVVVGSLAAGIPAHAASTDHRILMSDFRFCPERSFPCDPLDVGYVPTPGAQGAPAVAQYSPITTVSVKPGDTVTWVYSEPLCDNGVFCPPHSATFSDGSFDTPDLTSGTVTFTVPSDAKPGIVTYYCRYHGAVGMNGALQVVA